MPLPRLFTPRLPGTPPMPTPATARYPDPAPRRVMAAPAGVSRVRRRLVAAMAAAATLVLPLPAAVAAGPPEYTVRSGDTLSQLAARYGLDVDQVARVNGVDDVNRILAGAQLDLSGGTASGGTAPGGSAPGGSTPGSTSDSGHVVAPGETLSGIAARYGVGVSTLAAANDLSDADLVVAGATLQIPGSAPTAARPAPASASRATVERLLEQAAGRFGWSSAFIKAIAWQESGWNNDVVSSVGAVGIMQVLPSTNRDVSEERADRSLNLDEPADNIEAGMHYLELLAELTDGSADQILAGYYQGLRSVRQNGVYPSTENYIANVKALRDRYASG